MWPVLQEHDPGVEVGIEMWVELAHYDEHAHIPTRHLFNSFKENSP